MFCFVNYIDAIEKNASKSTICGLMNYYHIVVIIIAHYAPCMMFAFFSRHKIHGVYDNRTNIRNNETLRDFILFLLINIHVTV